MSVAEDAWNIVFCAQEPLTSLAAPAGYKRALSADPAYAEWATPAVVATLKARGPVYSWCDCSGTPPAAGLELRDRLGLDGFVGQAEAPVEYDNATAAGATVIVANPNALTPAQREDATRRINAGLLAVIAEVYTNEGDPWPDQYSSQGVPVAGFCIGVYEGRAGYKTIAEYRTRTPPGAWPTVGVYYSAGVRAGDWAALPPAAQQPPPPPPHPGPPTALETRQKMEATARGWEATQHVDISKTWIVLGRRMIAAQNKGGPKLAAQVKTALDGLGVPK